MSYTRLRYHIITATKRRIPLITEEVESVLYPVLYHKAQDCGGRLLQAGGVQDHIHLIVALSPTLPLSDFARVLKAYSSKAVNQSNMLTERFRWQRGYAAFTLNPYDLSGIIHYVRNQKQHHANGTLRLAYERMK